jgi:hypothetical protein
LSSFKLWRDGLVLVALVFGGALLFLSSVGFETTWTLDRWNGDAVAPDALQVRFDHQRRTSFSLLVDTAMPTKRDRAHLTTACGRYETRYARSLGEIAIDPLSDASCPNDQTLLDAFGRATRYKLGDGQMTLTTADGQSLLFRRAGPL